MKATNNHIQLLNEALKLLENKEASEEDISKAVRVVRVVMEDTVGHNLDFASFMEIRGRKSPNMRLELLDNLIDFLNRLALHVK